MNNPCTWKDLKRHSTAIVEDVVVVLLGAWEGVDAKEISGEEGVGEGAVDGIKVGACNDLGSIEAHLCIKLCRTWRFHRPLRLRKLL